MEAMVLETAAALGIDTPEAIRHLLGELLLHRATQSNAQHPAAPGSTPAPAVSVASPLHPSSLSVSSFLLPESLPESPPIVLPLQALGDPVPEETTRDATETAGRKSRKKPAGMLPPDFAEFWAEYPRKVDRGHALKAWQRAAKEGTMPPLAEILAALRRQTLSTNWQDEMYIPHPATWINGERWADAPAVPARASPGSPPDPSKIGPRTPGALCTSRKGWHMPQYDEKGNYIDD